MLLFLVVTLLFAFATATYAADGTLTITADNVEQVIKDAQAGDPDAIAAIQSLKALQQSEVEPKIKGVGVAANETKEIKFDDGSSVVLGSSLIPSSIVNAANGYTAADVSLASITVNWSAYYSFRSYGIEIGRYTMYYSYDANTSIPCIIPGSVYDAGSGVWPADVDAQGVTVVVDHSSPIQLRGIGKLITPAGSTNVRGNSFAYSDFNRNVTYWDFI